MHLLADAAGPATNASVTTAPSAPTTAPKTDAPFFLQPLNFVIIMGLLLLFLNMRGKRKQDKKVQDMLGNLKRGDRVQTIGGIIGTVVEARENDVLVKVDETNNTKIRFSRKAIHRVLEDETPPEKK